MSFLLGAANSSSTDEDESGKVKYGQIRREPQLHHDECTLLWWNSNQEQFPIIAEVACKLLCVLATSVPSEKIFLLLA